MINEQVGPNVWQIFHSTNIKKVMEFHPRSDKKNWPVKNSEIHTIHKSKYIV